MNYLVADYAGIASNCELAKALKNHIPLEVVYAKKDPYGLDSIVECKHGTFQAPFAPLPLGCSGDLLIIVSTVTFRMLLERRKEDVVKRFKRTIIIISDGWYMHEYGSGRIVYNEYNDWFKRLGVEVWVTHDKLQYRKGLPTKEFYQPFDFSKYDNITKYKSLTVSHSPFKDRAITKGSDEIEREVKKSGIKYDLITGLSWHECMKRKAKSHIFIDQIRSDKEIHKTISWVGGIGKSGFEGMGLKNVLISRGKYVGLELPAPPVLWIEDMGLANTLNMLKNNHNKRLEIVNDQYQWFLTYCNPDFQAKRILNKV